MKSLKTNMCSLLTLFIIFLFSVTLDAQNASLSDTGISPFSEAGFHVEFNKNRNLYITPKYTTTHGNDFGNAIYTYLGSTQVGQTNGVYNFLNNSGTGVSRGVYNYIDGSQIGSQFGTHNQINSTGSGLHIGSYNIVYGVSDGDHRGVSSTLQGVGNGPQYGYYTINTNTGNGDHYGLFSSMTGGSGIGTHYGAYLENTGTNNGVHYGIYNRLEGTGTGPQIATYNRMDNQNNNTNTGTFNVITSDGSGTHWGVHNALSGDGDGTHYGNYSNIVGAGNGDSYGTYNQVANGNASGTGTKYGSYNKVNGSGGSILYGSHQLVTQVVGSGVVYGGYNELAGNGNGIRYGTYNKLDGNGSGNFHGIQNELFGTGDGEQHGVYNSISNTGKGSKFGLLNNISGDTDATAYGVHSMITMNGPGSKYGTSNQVSGTGGQNVGGYFSAVNGTSNYAAIFYAGHVVANESGGNSDFRVESENEEYQLFVDASTDRIGIGTGVPSDVLHIAAPASENPVRVQVGGGTKFRIFNNGAVVFGNTTGVSDDVVYVQNQLALGVASPTYRIDVQNSTTNSLGKGRANAWTTYSDKRVKKNIKNSTYGLEEVLQIRPVMYDHYSSTFENGALVLGEDHSKNIGFIAQEMHQIITEIVDKPIDESKELWTVDYEKLSPVLVKAIQELAQENKELKEEIMELQAKSKNMVKIAKKNSLLEGRLDKIEEVLNSYETATVER